MEKEVLKTIRYFHFFQYAPLFDQIHAFLPKRVSRPHLKQTLSKMVKNRQLISLRISHSRRLGIAYQPSKNVKKNKNNSLLNTEYSILNTVIYALPPHRIYLKYRVQREKETFKKQKLIKKYLKIITYLSQIKLVGYSGSMALCNATKTDDIDLFVITAKKRLWTGRFLMILFALIINIKRSPNDKIGTNKVCLNMFIDERELILPLAKQNSYTGHEVLQMRPVISKGDVYQQFIKANKWVFRYFPNTINKSKIKYQKSKYNEKFKNFAFLIFILHFALCILNLIGDGIELVLKKIQLYLINRHRTSEIITDTQLWFFPEDFEKTLIDADLLSNSHK